MQELSPNASVASWMELNTDLSRPHTRFKKTVAVRIVVGVLAITAVWMICGTRYVSAGATTIDEYVSRIHRAARAIDSLHSIDETETDSDYQKRLESTANAVAVLLPSRESVSFRNSVVEVDNQWLADALNELQKAGARQANRVNEIDYIVDRLTALESELSNEKQTDAATNRDENKARMSAIMRRAEFNEQNQGPSALRRWWNWFVKWLSGLFGNTTPVDTSTVTKASKVVQYLVYGLVGTAILFAFWKLLPLLRRSRLKGKKAKRQERVVLGEKLSPEQTAADLLAEAELLARSGDLRAAIRKGYIAVLLELADRKLLRLERNNTNRDYLRALSARQEIFEGMKVLTGSFERHWYGLLAANEVDWKVFKEGIDSIWGKWGNGESGKR
jgi:hypothetical protein